MVNDINKLKEEVLDNSIPSAFTDSAATSNVGTTKDRSKFAFVETGRRSNKVFCMPNRALEAATAMNKLHHKLQPPARDVHIMPSIERDSLLSMFKFVEANYIAIFDKDKVNIYDANNTEVTVMRSAILQGFRCQQKMWQIQLVKMVKTTLCNRPPTKFLPNQPPPSEAIANVYKLKTQPELVRYYHARAGFPTKPTWIAAIKNKQFTSWPGLTTKVVVKHFPELEETTKGHGRKTRSGLQSTNKTAGDKNNNDEDDDDESNKHDSPPCPTKKPRKIYYKIYDLEDEAQLKMYTNQTGQFQKNQAADIKTSWY